MKRALPVAVVLMGAASWLLAVTQSPGPPRAEPAPATAGAPAPSPADPSSEDSGLSSERFTTGCGWCDLQVSDLGGTCLAFCGEHMTGMSCAAAGEGEGAVDALLSREQKHHSPIEDVREVWVRVSGSGTRVSDLARHLRSLSGWTVDVPTILAPVVVREGDLHAVWAGLSSRSLALADGRKLRIRGDGGRHIFELRAEGSAG